MRAAALGFMDPELRVLALASAHVLVNWSPSPEAAVNSQEFANCDADQRRVGAAAHARDILALATDPGREARARDFPLSESRLRADLVARGAHAARYCKTTGIRRRLARSVPSLVAGRGPSGPARRCCTAHRPSVAGSRHSLPVRPRWARAPCLSCPECLRLWVRR